MKNFKDLAMSRRLEMAICIKPFNRLIHPSSFSLRMQQMKTSYTSTISVMDVETSRFGGHVSNVQHAKMLIYVKHASIKDCRNLTLKKEEC
jgi:hypothetical protein